MLAIKIERSITALRLSVRQLIRIEWDFAASSDEARKKINWTISFAIIGWNKEVIIPILIRDGNLKVYILNKEVYILTKRSEFWRSRTLSYFDRVQSTQHRVLKLQSGNCQEIYHTNSMLFKFARQLNQLFFSFFGTKTLENCWQKI